MERRVGAEARVRWTQRWHARQVGTARPRAGMTTPPPTRRPRGGANARPDVDASRARSARRGATGASAMADGAAMFDVARVGRRVDCAPRQRAVADANELGPIPSKLFASDGCPLSPAGARAGRSPACVRDAWFWIAEPLMKAAPRGAPRRGTRRAAHLRPRPAQMSPLGRGAPALLSSPALMSALLAFRCASARRVASAPHPSDAEVAARSRASPRPNPRAIAPAQTDVRSPERPRFPEHAASRNPPRSSRTGASARRARARPRATRPSPLDRPRRTRPGEPSQQSGPEAPTPEPPTPRHSTRLTPTVALGSISQVLHR